MKEPFEILEQLDLIKQERGWVLHPIWYFHGLQVLQNVALESRGSCMREKPSDQFFLRHFRVYKHGGAGASGGG